MASHTGPTGLPLFLLCFMGTLLSITTAPINDGQRKQIVIELKHLSGQFLKDSDEVGLPSIPYQMESFAPYCQRPHYINSSAILPYFEAIRQLPLRKPYIEDIIQQLLKIQIPQGPDTARQVRTVPSNIFDRKRFFLALSQKFSACLQSL